MAIIVANFSYRYWVHTLPDALQRVAEQPAQSARVYFLGLLLIALAGLLLSAEWWRRAGWLFTIILLGWMAWSGRHRA